MSRYGMFGSGAPGSNRLNPLSLYDGILGPDPSPSNSFLAGVAPPRPTSNGFLSGLAGSPRSGGFLSGLIDPEPEPRYNGLTALLMDPPPPPPVETNALLSALMRLRQPEPQVIGTVVVSDGQIDYTFEIYDIDNPPDVRNADYIFGKDGRWGWYVGKTKNTGTRFYDHHKLDAAKAAGATEIWVHVPGPNAYVDYHEAEVRLIRRWKPPLNEVQYDAA